MGSLAIIGSQWGDEGKGKITDLLAAKSDLVIRYQGGNNAGHTIIVGDRKVILHLIPSGVLHAHALSLIGHGVVFDPRAFRQELDEVNSSETVVTSKNLKISENCSVITSYHKLLDQAREGSATVSIGTTGRGIGPAYEDKVGRRAILLKDLLDPIKLRQGLQECLAEKEVLFKQKYKISFPQIDNELEDLLELGKLISPYLVDTFSIINDKKDGNLLYEGAQGVMLDIDYGSYPFVTSSNTSAGGIHTGAGIPGGKVEEVLGITKAYTTRVGEGPFPTELFDKYGEQMSKVGHEFGATTGRPRRCGWLDLPLLKYSVKASNISSIALTKVDVLSGFEKLMVCTGYNYQGKKIDQVSVGMDLGAVEPIYHEMVPFNDDFKGDTLTRQLQDYIKMIEDFVEVPVGIIAYGPERSEIKFLKEYFK